MVKREKPHLTPPMTKRCPAHRHFDESVAKWSGVEKSPPLMVRAALRREISRLRVSWVPGSLSSISARSPARDDGVGEQHPVISEGDEPHSRHFDESVAKWRNLTPPMTKCRSAPPSFRPMKTYKKAVKKWFTFFTAFLRGLPMTSSGFYSFLSIHSLQSSSIGSRNSLLLMKDSLQA